MSVTKMVSWAFVGVLFVLSGCGGGPSGDASKLMTGLFNKSQSAATLQFKRVAQEAYQVAQSKAASQAWIAKFAAEAGQPAPLADPEFSIGDPDLSCTGTSSETSLNISCTCSKEDSFTCKGETYTMLSGSKFNINYTFSELLFSISMGIEGNVKGGEFGDSASVKCEFGFSFNFAAQNPEDVVKADCSNATFGCTIGSEKVGCEDILESMQDDGGKC